MKPKKIKARKMYQTARGTVCKNQEWTEAITGLRGSPVYILPADAASVEAMVEQMARAMANYPTFAPTFDELSRAALAAIGIKSTK